MTGRGNVGLVVSDEPKTTGEKIQADIQVLLKARNPVIVVISPEEARTERLLVTAAAAIGYRTRTWDVAAGVRDAGDAGDRPGQDQDSGAVLATIERAARSGDTKTLWILRDFAVWLAPPIGLTLQRQLKNLARLLPATEATTAQAVVLLGAGEIPTDLAGLFPTIIPPLPDRVEIGQLLDEAAEMFGAAPNGDRNSIIAAATGLTAIEVQNAIAASLVRSKRIDPTLIATEKKRTIAGVRGLEWFDSLPGGLDAVGGLEALKAWLLQRATAFAPEARAYGLPAPRGILLAGPPGSGKSMTAKAVATAWRVPLIKFDLGALRGKFVGESETQLRRALQVVDALGRCVLWVDEIEKALQGATSGSADGGVSADALGGLLTWLQDRQGAAFCVATSNDVSALPPELCRKGRFDETFFVDLPSSSEREAVLAAALCSHGREIGAIDLQAIAKATPEFSGAEIAALVPTAMFTAFADGARPVVTDDLLAAAAETVPLSKTAAEKIAAMRDWAKGRARFASAHEAAPGLTGRALDL
jgi:ATPase family associated with various cellular activities (AAA)/AAA+ lid domain